MQPPHQFRTRNNLNEPPQTRSKPNENAEKSTKAINILPLITVWLQVRVLPGPPRKTNTYQLVVSAAVGAPHQKRSALPPASTSWRTTPRLGRRYFFSVRVEHHHSSAPGWKRQPR